MIITREQFRFLMREERKQKGLTQRELADLVKIPQVTISGIETGKHVPTRKYAIKIKNALEMKGDLQDDWN